MNEQRFQCTACGKCCYGIVPLTLDDALAHADLFPLAMVWMPVLPTNRSYKRAAQLGATVPLPNKKTMAVLTMPAVYLPPSLACPALASDNLCTLQAQKPLRCQTMPFYPYREEKDQTDLLVPRKGWACDTGPEAPIVYQNRQILDRTTFCAESAALERAAPAYRAYVAALLKQRPALMNNLVQAAQNPLGGRFPVSFLSFLRRDKQCDVIAFAKKQHGVMAAYEAQTAPQPELAIFHGFYKDAAAELRWLAEQI